MFVCCHPKGVNNVQAGNFASVSATSGGGCPLCALLVDVQLGSGGSGNLPLPDQSERRPNAGRTADVRTLRSFPRDVFSGSFLPKPDTQWSPPYGQVAI